MRETKATEPGRHRGLTAADRLRAWLVTGPLGRLAGLTIEFAAAVGRSLRRLRR